jgi:hypothetical protein
MADLVSLPNQIYYWRVCTFEQHSFLSMSRYASESYLLKPRHNLFPSSAPRAVNTGIIRTASALACFGKRCTHRRLRRRRRRENRAVAATRAEGRESVYLTCAL